MIIFNIINQLKIKLIIILETFLFKDLTNNAISGLDGIRGLAILFVLGAHSNFISAGFGATGVWLFFVLSGYILSYKLLLSFQNTRFISESISFFIIRIFRILPIYYFVLFIYTIVIWNNNFKLFQMHILFEQAIWLFWTIKTEMLFYLFLPIIVALLSYISKKQIYKIIIAISILFSGYFLTEYLDIIKIHLAALNASWPFYITPFLLGILIAVINVKKFNYQNLLLYVSFTILLLLTIDTDFLISLRQYIGIDGLRIPWQNRELPYLFAAFTVLFSINSNAYLVENKYIKTFGTVSFSFYLWHTFVLVLLRKNFNLESYELFLLTFLITFILSVFSYHLIELPLHNVGRNLSKKYKSCCQC